MKGLAIAKDLTLPLDAVTQKFAFLGRTGSGKTYGATKLAEEMLDAGAQVVALDPVGVWYGLRLAANGKDPGIEIPVFGGLHGDIPLEPTAGTLLADLIVDRGISAILDVSQFESDTDKARFARDFAARFFFRKKAAPSAVHIFVEECQEFVPQNPQRGDEQMLHAFHRLIKLGRNFGIGLSLISQRPQEVNKKALNQTECMFAFQMTGPQERKAISLWVSEKGADEEGKAKVPGRVVEKPVVDQRASDQAVKRATEAAQREDRRFRQSIKAEIARATRQLAQSSALIDQLRTTLASLESAANASFDTGVKSEPVPFNRDPLTKIVERIAVPPAKRPDIAPTNGDASVSGAQQRILDAIATLNALGIERPSIAQVALFVGVSHTTGSYQQNVRGLAESGYLERDAGLLSLTGHGRTYGRPDESRDPIEFWKRKLGGAQARLLDLILERYPHPISREDLAAKAGVSHTTGSFQQNLRDMETYGIIERPPGQALASELLFP